MRGVPPFSQRLIRIQLVHSVRPGVNGHGRGSFQREEGGRGGFMLTAPNEQTRWRHSRGAQGGQRYLEVRWRAGRTSLTLSTPLWAQ